MAFDTHATIAPTLIRALEQLRHVLRKGADHAAAQGWDPAVLLGMRLAPDMFPLSRQVQIASDIAKGGAARLGGAQPPAYDDTETSFADLDARLAKTIDYIRSVPADAYEGAESRAVAISPRGRGDLNFDGSGYFFSFVLPNVYFHAATAYGLLRHAGVPLGKMDFLGPIGTGG